MYQVKFYITASSYFLPFGFLFSVCKVFSFPDNGNICRQKSVPIGLLEQEQLFGISAVFGPQVVIKYTADTSCLFITMLVDKIFVALLFVGWVQCRSKRIEGGFQRLVKMLCIFFKQ